MRFCVRYSIFNLGGGDDYGGRPLSYIFASWNKIKTISTGSSIEHTIYLGI